MSAATLTENVESAELYNYSIHRDFNIKREGCEDFTINTEDLKHNIHVALPSNIIILTETVELPARMVSGLFQTPQRRGETCDKSKETKTYLSPWWMWFINMK